MPDVIFGISELYSKGEYSTKLSFPYFIKQIRMVTHWSERLLIELQNIDEREVPHGIYGLRESRRTGKLLPGLAHVLRTPPIDIVKRIGADPKLSKLTDHCLSFVFKNGDKAKVEILTYANTKVRLFGDSYRIDNTIRIPRAVPQIRDYLGSIYHSNEYDRFSDRYSRGLLLIAHFTREKDAQEMIKDSCDPSYLSLHSLSTSGKIWKDKHSRNFWSVLQIWYKES